MINLSHHPTRFRNDNLEIASGDPGFEGQNGAHMCDRRLQLVLRLVADNMRRQLVIRELAEAVNLSSGRLAHLFKSEVGISPQRYLTNIRMEKAKDLLEDGGLSVKEIAAHVGMPNPSRFCRSFKARYGITPTEYRKANLRIEPKSICVSASSV
jgi:AraC-like DNA-binding protein